MVVCLFNLFYKGINFYFIWKKCLMLEAWGGYNIDMTSDRVLNASPGGCFRELKWGWGWLFIVFYNRGVGFG